MAVKTAQTGTQFVQYLRVSTQKQGVDGNGIAAQERDLDIFLGHQPMAETIGRFVEVESGANNERPELEAASNLQQLGLTCLFKAQVDRDVELIAKLQRTRELR